MRKHFAAFFVWRSIEGGECIIDETECIIDEAGCITGETECIIDETECIIDGSKPDRAAWYAPSRNFSHGQTRGTLDGKVLMRLF